MIPYGRQDIREEDIEAVVEVLRSDFLTQGPVVQKFEETVASYSNVRFAVALNSATSALHAACMALELGPGDILWTSPISFVASANCGLYCGASVDFVDINERTYNLCPDALRLKLEVAEKNGQLPKILIPVHLCGQSCDMEVIYRLSNQYGFRIIEDASHAIGGKYRDMPIGGCQYSDITVFSFHPVKIITTGEGGMALTNNPTLARRLEEFRSHGITRDPTRMTAKDPGGWYYEQTSLGYNYRMTDIQAALGISQMTRLNEYVKTRHLLAGAYDEMLKETVIIPFQAPGVYSSYHLYVVLLQESKGGSKRRDVYDYLRIKGFGVNVHYIPIFQQPYYIDRVKNPQCPNAISYYNRALTLPCHPRMNQQIQTDVCKSLLEALE
jgi:UDP-4-amino-4,6-dideoxy-N-acetyl-beta-L-altrosamine transaminase